MSLYPSERARQRIIDRYTPPASVDEPVRESRVPDAACAHCGAVHGRHQLGRVCGGCGVGVVARLPADRWQWCRACSGRGACCSACNWHGVVLRPNGAPREALPAST
ncbi:hypothetical protein FHW12_000363 [Dokdonella fugitiva]|uniref:Uncharacterized protein n=1 Tax=Dokdonella fugitiva TaxID=328517 RepID=A0A839EWM0_9GAMM|nr:hypothetical protein [Dokdonella fugitiva]